MDNSLGSLILGTAQIGMCYGISNRSGKPSSRAAQDLLATAWDLGIRELDTASAYGDSECLIGEFLSGVDSSAMRVTTKVDGACALDLQSLSENVSQSLERLQCQSIWCLMIHREDLLDALEGEAGEILQTLKRDGTVKSIGISIYSESAARLALASPCIDAIQVPGNVFDRRFFSSDFSNLAKNASKRITVRSVYLQGLALMDVGVVPERIVGAKDGVASYAKFCERAGISRDQFAIQYVLNRSSGAPILLGAESAEQVRRNCEVFERGIDESYFDEWDSICTDTAGFHDPTRWPAA